MKKTVEVNLFNHKFKVKSDNDEKHVQKVADFVNEKIFDIQNKTQSVSSLNVSLLAALNIADEYFKMKGGKKGGNEKAVAKAKDIIKLIDHYLEEA